MKKMLVLLFLLLPELPWVSTQGIQVVRRGKLYPKSYFGHIWIKSNFKNQVSKVIEVLDMNEDINSKTHQYGKHFDELKPWNTERNLKKENVENKLTKVSLVMSEMSPEVKESENSENRVERSVSVSLDIGQFFRDVITGIRNFFNRSQMDQIEKTEAEHSHQINVLDHKVDELSDHVDNITANMEDQWLKYNKRVGIIAINSQYMMALDKSDFVLDTIINALIDLHNGKISTSLVPIEVAEEAVANSTAIVRSQGKESTMKKGIDFYVQKSSYYLENGELSLLVSFESYDPQMVMELVELVDFPWYDSEDKVALKLKNDKNFVAIGQEDEEGRRPGVILSAEEFQTCWDMYPEPNADEWICPAVAIYRNASETCEGAIVLGQPLDKCQFEILENVQQDYKYLSDGTLVFFFPETDVITMTCGEEVRYVSTALGIYRPLLSEDCEIKTSVFVIPPKPSIPEVIVLQTLGTVDLSPSMLESEIEVSLDIIPSSALQNFKDSRTPEYKKHQNFQIPNPNTTSSDHETYILILGILVGITIFLVLVICIFLVCRACKVTSQGLNNIIN